MKPERAPAKSGKLSGRLLPDAAARLRARGVEEPELNAQWLLAAALGVERMALLADLSAPVPAAARRRHGRAAHDDHLRQPAHPARRLVRGNRRPQGPRPEHPLRRQRPDRPEPARPDRPATRRTQGPRRPGRPLLQAMSDSDWAGYITALQSAGEVAALQWLIAQKAR